MSTNIDHWETLKLDEFRLPLASLRHPRYSMEVEYMGQLGRGQAVRVTGPAEGFEVVGILIDGVLHVDKIVLYGEFSGTYYFDTLEDALRQSKGTLTATLAWMEGERIQHLKVVDGVIRDAEKEKGELLERLFELLPDVEWAIEAAEYDTDQFEGHLDTHPGLDNEEERASIAKRRKWADGAHEFVRLFGGLKED